jgi:large conductance mechanosensitive channel
MKKFFEDFKTFALRGNVIDLAVGVIIGAAFQAVVKSLVDDIISPVIGLLTGRNFDALTLDFLGVSLRYGAFITSVVNFVIMVFVVFLIVKLTNRAAALGKKPAPAAAPTTKPCPYCKTEISIEATRCPHCTSVLD